MKIRKFKHKKTGHIFEQDGSYYNRPKHEHIPAWLVEGSNDWEEIIEKDYEILSYKHGDGQISDIEYINKCLKVACLHEGWKIHSVKRLSDGEIFTIGDNCSYGVITRIFITREGYCMTSTTSPYSCNILYLKHKKQPLFTTEDGVDIFEGDVCFSIIKSNYQYSGVHCWVKREWFTKTSLCNDKLYFSNKEKAQEYVDLNKPKYSLNDIRNIFDSDVLISKTYLTQSLKNLNK